MTYLIVILDQDAPSFCSYPSPPRRMGNALMPLEMLERVVSFAIRQRLTLNFLHGHQPLPAAYERVMESVDHINIVPLARDERRDDAIFIVEAGSDPAQLDRLAGGDLNNVILRVAKDQLASIEDTTRRLMGKFARLNIILEGIGDFDASSFSLYEAQLDGVRKLVEDAYNSGDPIEINVVSDRLYLTNMNNCNAGVDHLTVAPNGRLYLCPAFYYDDEESHVGELGDPIAVANGRLLQLDHAPICRNCDAYQCKRCVYLNQRLSSELNTPSHQQCVAAHLERNASRQLRLNLGSAVFADDRPPQIPAIDYLDPFELLNDRSLDPKARQRHFAELLAVPLERVPVRDLLAQIHALDPSILTKLKAMNHALIEPEPPASDDPGAPGE